MAQSAELAVLACPRCRAPLNSDSFGYRCATCGTIYLRDPHGVTDFIQSPQGGEYDDEYFAARHFEDLDPYFKTLFENAFRAIAKPGPLRILDAGSGLGVYSAHFRSLCHDVFSIDASEAAARLSKGFRASVLSLPFQDQVFDIVLAAHILEHLTDQEIRIFLRETDRVLTRNGLLIVMMPNGRSLTRPFLGDRWFPDPTHINIKTTHAFMRLLREERFRKIAWRHRIPMLLESKKPPEQRWLMPYFGLGVRLRKALWIQDLLFWLLTSTPLATFREVMFVTSLPPKSDD